MSEPQHTGPALSGKTILVVDDQAQIRGLIRQVLEPRGAVILDAANAYRALAVWQRHKDTIALAIIDFLMPGMSGLDLAAQLQRDKPALKILYMSSAVESIAMESLIRRSPDLVLLKPFTVPELLEKLHAILDNGLGALAGGSPPS